jgi:hypothetical protein
MANSPANRNHRSFGVRITRKLSLYVSRMATRGTLPTLGACPHGVGKQPSAAQLSATFAAFDDRPNQLPGAVTDLPGWRS